jgi:hypothetical protein
MNKFMLVLSFGVLCLCYRVHRDEKEMRIVCNEAFVKGVELKSCGGK